MTNVESAPWPYLSPARPGWWLVSGPRGQIRRLLTRDIAVGRDEPPPLLVVLDALHALAEAIDLMDQDLLALVAEAHHRGASWSQIARRLGRSKQSVHQRYQRRMHSTRTRELLRRDYVSAFEQARELCQRGKELEKVEAAAFLRDRLTRRAPVKGRREELSP